MKHTSEPLQESELFSVFEENDYILHNKQKIEFELHLPETIMATAHLVVNKRKKHTIDLLADYDNIDSFISANEIVSFNDLNNISRSTIWTRYLRGDGYVCCDIYPIESELCFRIVKGITIAYSLRLNFYDEVYKALSLPEQFEQYIAESWEYLHMLCEFKTEIEIPKLSAEMFQRFGK